MNKPRVNWSEGLFMRPAHMQLLEDYHEELLHTRLSALGRESYGVLALQVRVGSGIVSVDFTGVMPDGTYVEAQGLTKTSEEIGGAGTVYVALKSRDKGVRFATEQSKDAARYRLQQQMVRDWNRDEPDDLGFIGMPDPVLLLAPTDEYTSIPVAKLQRSGGDHKLVPDFVPPCLRIGVSPWLTKQLYDLVVAMNDQKAALSRQASGAGAGGVARLPQVAAQVQLSALGRAHLPLLALAGFLEGASGRTTPPADLDAHPLALHRELLALIGALSAFAPDNERAAHWERLPPFAFDDLGGTFAPLFELANVLVGALGLPGHLTIKLDATENRPQYSVFSGRLPNDPGWRQKRPLLWVKLPSGGDPRPMAENGRIKAFPPSGPVRWDGRNDSVSVATAPPEGLPPPEAGSAYFTINQTCWSQIAASGDFVIYAPNGATVELRSPPS